MTKQQFATLVLGLDEAPRTDYTVLMNSKAQFTAMIAKLCAHAWVNRQATDTTPREIISAEVAYPNEAGRVSMVRLAGWQAVWGVVYGPMKNYTDGRNRVDVWFGVLEDNDSQPAVVVHCDDGAMLVVLAQDEWGYFDNGEGEPPVELDSVYQLACAWPVQAMKSGTAASLAVACDEYLVVV